MSKPRSAKRLLLVLAAVVVGYLLLGGLYRTQMGPNADTAPKTHVSDTLDGSHNSALPPPDPAHLTPAERRAVRTAYAALVERGLVREAELPARRAYLDRAQWTALDADAQQETARLIALYFTEQTGRSPEPWDFYDPRTGERLARFVPPAETHR